MDAQLRDALDALSAVRGGSVVVPEHAVRHVPQNFQAIAYVSLPDIRLSSVDAAIVHKGQMANIGIHALTTLYFTWHPLFANGVYVVFAREEPAANTPDQGAPAEDGSAVPARAAAHELNLDHLGAVEVFLSQSSVRPARAKTPNRAVVVSAHGVGNVGDDLVTLASVKLLNDIGLSDVVISGPRVTSEQIAAADVVALGGGGLFYDWDVENLGNYLFPISEGRRLGKKVVAIGVGTQGINTAAGQAAFRRVLPEADLVCVRSSQDCDQLLAINPALNNVEAFMDVAYYMADELKAAALSCRRTGQLALFSLSSLIDGMARRGNWTGDELYVAVIEHLRRKGYTVLLVQHSVDDEAMYKRLAQTCGARIVKAERLGPMGTARLIGSASLLVTSRFHALILASIVATPVVSVYSQTSKNGRLVSGYLPSLAGHCQSSNDISIAGVLEKIDRAGVAAAHETQYCIDLAIRMRDRLKQALFE